MGLSSGKRGLSCCGGGRLEQASVPLRDPRRGPAPHPHPVFVQGAGGHCVRAGYGGPGNPPPPPPRPGPLGNSKKTSGVSGGSPAVSLPERPGDGLSEVRPQIRGSFPLPLSLLETLSPIEKSLQGFGSLTLSWYLNRNNNNNKKPKPHTATSGRVLLAPSRRRRAKGRARARGLGSRVAGGRCRVAALDPGDGGGSKRGGRFLSFVIPVSPSGLPACRVA